MNVRGHGLCMYVHRYSVYIGTVCTKVQYVQYVHRYSMYIGTVCT